MRLILSAAAVSLVLAWAASAGAGAGADSLGPAPTDLPQTWIASLHVSGHVFHEGDLVTVTVKVNAAKCFRDEQCVQEAAWSLGAGVGRIVAGCKVKIPPGTPTVKCSFRAVETEGWTTVEANFKNPTGTSAISRDFYAVVGPTTRVISGTVTHPYSGRGIAGVPIAIDGPKRHITLRTDVSGFFSATVSKRGSYSVSYEERHRFVPHSAPTVHVNLGTKAVANFELRRKHRFGFGLRHDKGGAFRGSALVYAGPGKQVIYRGEDWDAEGSQIVVSSDGKEISKPSTFDNFAGVVMQLDQYPTDACRVKVTATQDKTKQVATAFAPQTVRVVYAAGGRDDVHVRGGRPTRTGDFICAGELIEVGGQGVGVYQSIRKEAGFQGQAIASASKSIHVDGGIFAPRIQFPLADGSTVTVKGVGGGDVSEYDWKAIGKTGVQTLPAELDTAAALSGFLSRDGNLHVTSRLALDGAYVFVRGNATIEGGVSGTGAVIATGSITVRGPVALKSDNGLNSLRSSGPLIFLGS